MDDSYSRSRREQAPKQGVRQREEKRRLEVDYPTFEMSTRRKRRGSEDQADAVSEAEEDKEDEEEDVDIEEDEAEEEGGADEAKPAEKPAVSSRSLLAIIKKISVGEAKLKKLNEQLTAKKLKHGYKGTLHKRQEDVKKWEDKVAVQTRVLKTLNDQKINMETRARALAALAEKKEEEKKITAEGKRDVSSYAQQLVVKCKVKQDKRFDGRKEKADDIWVDVHNDYMAGILEHGLSVDDKISKEGLRAKYDRELSFFRDYCKKMNRMAVSGAPRDDMDNVPRRCVASCSPCCCPRTSLTHKHSLRTPTGPPTTNSSELDTASGR